MHWLYIDEYSSPEELFSAAAGLIRKDGRKPLNKKQKEQLKRWIIIIFSVLILFYIVHQVRMVTYKSVRTESVPSVTANDSVKTKVFVVRSEQYVRNRSSGTVISLVNDGNRVSNGGGVAAIFRPRRTPATTPGRARSGTS